MLSRVHKWWRATVTTYLHNQHMLDHSLWSYGTVSIGDRPEDNPIQLSRFPGLDTEITDFLAHAPYRCDDLTAEQHNQHDQLVRSHYEDSYCHLVMETLYDADGSGGTFLTEKTFKPICMRMPFVLAGTQHSLRYLHSYGFRTFGDIWDESYDDEPNDVLRMERIASLLRSLDELPQSAKQDLFWACQEVVEHNHRHFYQGAFENILWQELTDMLEHMGV